MFLLLDGQEKGPFHIDQIQSMWQHGEVAANTLFWREGMDEWQPLSNIAGELGKGAGALATAVVAPSRPIAASSPATVRRQQPIFGAIVLLGIAIVVPFVIYNAANDPDTKSSLPRVLQNQYKVTMPNGDIVTMTESELETFNKERLKDREKLLGEFDETIDKTKKELERIQAGSPPP